MPISVERFSQPVAFHGEGPVWDGSWTGLRFVDMLAGDIVCLDRDGAVAERLHVGGVAAAFRPRASGGMVVAVERGFLLIDDQGGRERLPDLWEDTGVRMNEGACDPDGRFYCGSMAYDMTTGAGAVYCLSPDRSVRTVMTAVTCSNGLGWTPDNRTAYYIDSLTRRVDVFDYAAAEGLTNRRPFVSVAADLGLPDGLTVDNEGGVWVALFGGSAVHRYAADGSLDEVLRLPVSQVTACTFGGPELDELYITTSREELADGEQPDAGSVYRARPGVSGRPPHPFAG